MSFFNDVHNGLASAEVVHHARNVEQIVVTVEAELVVVAKMMMMVIVMKMIM